uniref:P53 and DNA damage-regulated protein 1 n=1 Tax=Acrobeloides nanus TaxID=290746 RepID=A0A914E6D9_9BILA
MDGSGTPQPTLRDKAKDLNRLQYCPEVPRRDGSSDGFETTLSIARANLKCLGHETTIIEAHALVGRTLVNFDENQEVCIRILSCGKSPVFLPKNTYVAKLESLRDANEEISKKMNTIATTRQKLTKLSEEGEWVAGDLFFASPELDIYD